MSEPMTFQKKSRRERYIVRDDVAGAVSLDRLWPRAKSRAKQKARSAM